MKFKQFTEEMRGLLERGIGKGYQVEVRTIVINNACPLTGLVIHKNGENIGPVVYMEPYYRKFMEGSGLEQLAEELIEDYQNNEVEQISDDLMRSLMSWGRVKDMILYKVVNTEKNKKMLEKMPHREYLDLSIIYYLYFGEHDAGQFTAPVNTELMNLWGVTEEDIYRAAKNNTSVIMPVVIKTIEDVLNEMLKNNISDELDKTLFKEVFTELIDEPILYVCTNRIGMNGAACILYEGVLAEFAERKGCDIVILPSSIHEALLLPDNGEVDYDELREMVECINGHEVADEDVLSDRVYRYSLAEGEIELVR